ncbi:hypothetical protein V490_06673 [Pseudogymnoascus sp. VKM F-3557]|nr:hypothetical protein V490_06673 [Pseudogymnoascus sp. VKM F-3557]
MQIRISGRVQLQHLPFHLVLAHQDKTLQKWLYQHAVCTPSRSSSLRAASSNGCATCATRGRIGSSSNASTASSRRAEPVPTFAKIPNNIA